MVYIKSCAHCGIEKNLGKFAPDANSPDGRQYWCRQCVNESAKKRRNAKPKELIAPLVDGTKSCSTCKIEKSYEEFTVDSRRKDGRQPRCRECYKRIRSEQLSDRQKKKYELELSTGMKLCNHCGETKSLDRMVKKPPGNMHQGISEYWPKCLDCATKYQKEYSERRRIQHAEWSNKNNHIPEGKARYLLNSVRNRAKKNGLEFDLDLQWFLDRINQPCEKTGMKFEIHGWKGKRELRAPSVDKIDPSRGYTKDNCQLVVLMYNICKNDGTDKDVIEMAKGVIAVNASRERAVDWKH